MLQKILFAAATAALLICNMFVAKAQSEGTNHRHSDNDLGIFIGGGVNTFNFSNINTILASQGIPEIKEVRPAFAIGFISRLDEHYMLELGFTGQNSKTNTGLIKMKAGTFAMDLNLSYNFLNSSSRSDLYAGVGVGWMYTTATVDLAQAFPNFATALGSLSSERSLSAYYNFYGNLRVGYDYALNKNKDILIGAKAMYRLGVNKDEWKLGPSQATYNAAPTQTASGFTGVICLTFY